MTEQSSLYTDWVSQNAVDGDDGSCTHTADSSGGTTDPWLRVNLVIPNMVLTVAVKNRNTLGDR